MKYKHIGYLVTTRDMTRQFDPTLYPDDIRAAMEKNGIKFEAVYAEVKE
jgi:uncharacterized protein YneF (UPF0154 family)